MKNRMKLFIKLVCNDNEDVADKDLLSKYNKHYAEVYTYFNIMQDCLIGLDEIDYFDEPVVKGDTFTIIFELKSPESKKILKDYVKKNSIVKDMADFELDIRCPRNGNIVELSFTKIS